MLPAGSRGATGGRYPGDMERPRRLVVPPALDGERLDRGLVRLLRGQLSRTRIQELIQDGGVRVDGAPAERAAQILERGQEIELHHVPRSRQRPGGPAGAELAVLFEDEHLAVVEKPAGQLAHPTTVVTGGTVSELAVERWGALPAPQGDDRPGIVHRLDADTSGLMVLARGEPAAERLVAAFRERAVEKSYLALVHGEPRFDSDWITARIGRASGRSVPMYRDLGPGDSGADVSQLEANLAELGYAGFTVDHQYTEFTAQAVRAWQEDVGAEASGTVARGDVVFVPEGGRVDALHAAVGDRAAPGTAVLDLTGTDQVASLEVDVDDRDRFAVGAEVVVLLPGGDEVAGTVGATAVVEVRPEGPDGDSESILQVEVTLDETVSEEFVGAAVEVVVAVDERTDVLLVPVNALLALAEGGYGLEVVADDGTTSIVPVETGLFAEGTVEVRSADIAEGTVVGVAGR